MLINVFACESKNLAEAPTYSIVLRKCLEIDLTRVSMRIQNKLTIIIRCYLLYLVVILINSAIHINRKP